MAARGSSGYAVAFKAAAGLRPYERNARTHSPEQIAQIKASMLEFGFTNPVLVVGAEIVAGHGRVLAAAALHAEARPIKLMDGSILPLGKVPTIDCSEWTDAQRKAYILADNQIALNAGWDMDLLKLELNDLSVVGFDLTLTGFDDKFLKNLLNDGNSGEGDPDDTPPAPADPVTMLGDVWLLGKHRVVCGDSTTAYAVALALHGVQPDLMVTDPPYGVKVNADPRKIARLTAKDGAERASGKLANDDRSDWREAWALFPGNVAYVWHAGMTRFEVEASLRAVEFETRAEIIWRKPKPTMRAGNISPHSTGYSWQHESCLYAVRKGGRVDWCGDKSQTTVWDIDHSKSETGHPTQKPVEAMLRPIQNNSSPGQAVYDPFVGSGTTIIAAEMSGRVCHSIDLDPCFVDVSVLRFQQFTGVVAVLEATGKTFAEVLAERQPGRVIVQAPARKGRKAS